MALATRGSWELMEQCLSNYLITSIGTAKVRGRIHNANGEVYPMVFEVGMSNDILMQRDTRNQQMVPWISHDVDVVDYRFEDETLQKSTLELREQMRFEQGRADTPQRQHVTQALPAANGNNGAHSVTGFQDDAVAVPKRA